MGYKNEPVSQEAGDGSGLIDKSPTHLIIETSDLIRDFEQNVGEPLHDRDVQSIVSAVVQSLVLEEYAAKASYVSNFVDFNGMRSSAFYKSQEFRQRVHQASHALAAQLHQRFCSYGVYESGEFPYMFDRFLSNGDVILFRLPH